MQPVVCDVPIVCDVECVCTVPPSMVPACAVVTREHESLLVVVGVLTPVVGAVVGVLPVAVVGVELPAVGVLPPPQAASKRKAMIANPGTTYRMFSRKRRDFACFWMFFILSFRHMCSTYALS